jgi:hypothetical protein
MVSLDEIRARFPDVGVALYALDPGQPVTLEIYAADGQVFSWKDLTVAGALAQAFPQPTEPQPEPPAPETPGLFD